MASSFEKSVKGATKIKAAPPKTKYIEHILIATHSGEHGVAEVFRALQPRIKDSTWTVVFKSLITVHLMIREGSPDVTLEFIAQHKNMLAISSFTDVQTQGRNIRHYSNYLTERARAYRDTKCDWVRGAERKMDKLTVDKGLLRETETIQRQISSLLKCDLFDEESPNDITITVFRMLILDLLALFHVMNQALIRILGQFFEMSKSDAERAMEVYRRFTKQTDLVVSFLGTARQYEHQTRVEVPKLNHAPVHLGKQLEDYLSDPDFDINRRQYLAEQEAKKFGKSTDTGAGPSFSNATGNGASKSAVQNTSNASSSRLGNAPVTQPAKGPDPDLIDFFDSIEQNQQPMATQPGLPTQNYAGAPQFLHQPAQLPQPQQQPFQQPDFFAQQAGFPGQFQYTQQQPSEGFVQQSSNQGIQQPPQMQPNFTGAGFGGYTPQQNYPNNTLTPISQTNSPSFQNQNPQSLSPDLQQTTNPFRISMMTNPTGMQSPMSPPVTSPIAPQSTNPFARNIAMQQPQNFLPPVSEQFQQPQQGQNQHVMSPLQPMQTGTNPFARNQTPPTVTQRPQTAGQLLSQPTGSTNPFRQSQFVNTNTGIGWQHNQQPIGGGLDHLETMPVFPRPAQQQPWQQ